MFGIDDIVTLVESTLFLDILAKFKSVIYYDKMMYNMRLNCKGDQSCLNKIL